MDTHRWSRVAGITPAAPRQRIPAYGAKIHGAKIHGAKIHGAKIHGAKIHGARFMEPVMSYCTKHGLRSDLNDGTLSAPQKYQSPSKPIQKTDTNPGKIESHKARDARLVMRMKNGDSTAFTRLVEYYRPLIVRYVARIVKDVHIAQDLCQEVFLRAHEHLSELTRVDLFRSWLFRIAFNTAVDWIRHRPQKISSINDHEEWAEPTSPHPLTQSQLLSPEDVCPRVFLLHLIAEALSRLPEPTRRVMAARYLRGLSCRDVAQEMGWSIGNVKVRLHRGRRFIKVRVQARAPSPDDSLGGFRIAAGETPRVRMRF